MQVLKSNTCLTFLLIMNSKGQQYHRQRQIHISLYISGSKVIKKTAPLPSDKKALLKSDVFKGHTTPC